MSKFVPRTCEYCGRPGGTTAFRYEVAATGWHRGYFHPDCFKKFLGALEG